MKDTQKRRQTVKDIIRNHSVEKSARVCFTAYIPYKDSGMH